MAEPVGSNVAEGRPVGVIEENGEQVWRVHALGGLTVTESDAGSVRVSKFFLEKALFKRNFLDNLG